MESLCTSIIGFHLGTYFKKFIMLSWNHVLGVYMYNFWLFVLHLTQKVILCVWLSLTTLVFTTYVHSSTVRTFICQATFMGNPCWAHVCLFKITERKSWLNTQMTLHSKYYSKYFWNVLVDSIMTWLSYNKIFMSYNKILI